ncbi:MAG TPA: arginine decarboxylase, partial [Anaeromyxobacter sp.]
MSLPDRRSDATTAMAPSDWSIERATQYYNVSGWGAGYFSVNEKGHVIVHPMGQPGPAIDLMDVVEDIRERKIGFPCVVRFQDVLRARVKQINEAFGKAVAEMGYGARYFGVYPIKVNQMREVVEEILDAGAPYHYGLEAGSKGELLVVLGMNTDPEALTICNGYKDEEFMRLALMGQKLGHTVMIVLEQLNELEVLLKVADEMGIQPTAGVRVKLATEGSGRWAKSGGERSKFGLGAVELMRLLDELDR